VRGVGDLFPAATGVRAGAAHCFPWAWRDSCLAGSDKIALDVGKARRVQRASSAGGVGRACLLLGYRRDGISRRCRSRVSSRRAHLAKEPFDGRLLRVRSAGRSFLSGPVLPSGSREPGVIGGSSTQRRIGSSLCIRVGTYCPGALVRPVCGRCVGSLVAAVVPVVCPPDLEPPVPLPGGRFFLGGSAVTKLRHPRGHRRRRRWTRSPSPAAPARPG
jgi:hypothetical protein